MELSFVISALKKRFWIIALFAIAGFLLGLTLAPSDISYQAESKLVVRQPVGDSQNSERYIATELNVIESSRFVRETAEQFPELEFDDVAEAIEVEHDPETDIVSIIARHPVQNLPIPLANAYANAYIDSVQSGSLNPTETEQIRIQLFGDPEDEESIGLIEQVEDINQEIDSTVPSDVISLEVAAPDLEWERTRLTNEISVLQDRLNALEVPANSRVFDEAVRAVPISSGSEIFIFGGLVAGSLLGLLTALSWARFSTKVLDEFSVGELLGTPVVAQLPHYRSLSKNILAAFRALPRSAVPVIDQLCVRSEAKAKNHNTLVVAVVGTQRGAGSSTLAMAMAERFATGGSSVVLVDGDVRDPKVTEAFNGQRNGGIPAVLANDGALVDREGFSVFTKTMDPRVSVLGLGATTRLSTLKRDNVARVIEAASRKGQIVVVDAGPALDLASTIQAIRLADAVVLATPISRQKVDELADLGRQLNQVTDKLLPVITVPAKVSNSRKTTPVDVDLVSIETARVKSQEATTVAQRVTG